MAMIVFGLYLDEKSTVPYFIEKGSQFWYLHRHWRMFKKEGKHFNEDVNRIFEETGRPPHIRYFYVTKDKEIARQVEAKLIKHFGRQNNGTGILFNKMDGGFKKFTESSVIRRLNGWNSLSPEQRAQIGANMSAGKKRASAIRRLISVIQQLICLKQAESR